MDLDNNENNRNRPREDEEGGNNNGEGDRNVQQRTDVLISRTGCFRVKVPLSVDHLQVVDRQSSNNSKSISPTLTIRSLQQHMMDGGGHGSAMVFIITSINTASTSGRTQVQMQRGPNGRNQLNQVSHSRTIHLLDPKSESGSNMAVMFHGSGNNTRMLAGDTSIVNDGTLRVGAVVLMINVPDVEHYMVNTPVVTTTRPLLVLANEHEFPERPINTEGTSISGYIINNCNIDLQIVHIYDSSCGGNLCDQQGLKDSSGVIKSRCSCIQATTRNGKPMFGLTVEVRSASGVVFKTELISKNFMKQYVFIGSLPEGARAHMFQQQWEVEDRLYQKIQSVFNFINRHGGFRVIGWTRRGEVLDQGVDQPNNGLPYNAARVMVEAGTLRYHITRVDPMTPLAIDLDVLHRLKFDVSTDL